MNFVQTNTASYTLALGRREKLGAIRPMSGANLVASPSLPTPSTVSHTPAVPLNDNSTARFGNPHEVVLGNSRPRPANQLSTERVWGGRTCRRCWAALVVPWPAFWSRERGRAFVSNGGRDEPTAENWQQNAAKCRL